MGSSARRKREGLAGRAPLGVAHTHYPRDPPLADCGRPGIYRRAGMAWRRLAIHRHSEQAYRAMAPPPRGPGADHLRHGEWQWADLDRYGQVLVAEHDGRRVTRVA